MIPEKFYSHPKFVDVFLEVIDINASPCECLLDVKVRWYVKGVHEAWSLPDDYIETITIDEKKFNEFYELNTKNLKFRNI